MKLLGGKRSAPAVRSLVPGCSVASVRVGRARGTGSACVSSRARLRPVFVPTAGHAFSPGGEPASAPCSVWSMGAGDNNNENGPGGPASRSCPTGATPAHLPSRGPRIHEQPMPARARQSASPWRVRARGSGTDARACVRRPWRVLPSSGVVSDAGGTALIDPS